MSRKVYFLTALLGLTIGFTAEIVFDPTICFHDYINQMSRCIY